MKNSLVYNLIASLKGWKIPITPLLLGPLRNWIKLKTLRSSNVRKATLIKEKRLINKYVIILTNISTCNFLHK